MAGIFLIGILLILVLIIFLIIKLVTSPSKKKQVQPSRKQANGRTTRGLVRRYNASTETLPKTVGANHTTETLQVWRFALERHDEDGNELPLISVQIKGQRLSGYITEGDEVEIFDEIIPGQIVTPVQIYNHTANSYVEVEDETVNRGGCAKPLGIILLIIVLIAIIVFIISKYVGGP